MSYKPVKRNEILQYGKQTIEQNDIVAILEVLNENKFLTTGPKIREFEERVCEISKHKYAIAVSNGTAALHCAIYAANIKSDDEVIVTTMSFVASANCILYENAIPVFCDINEDTLNINSDKIEKLITSKTRAIIVVDFAGQLCDYKKIRKIAKKYNLIIIEDASHSFGVTREYPNCGDLITYSFHPVKNITTGEGGMIVTNNKKYADRMRQFRSHGIDNDYNNRRLHYYEMIDIGYNYRITDIQCALGISQCQRIDEWISRRQYLASLYTKVFKEIEEIIPLKLEKDCAYHIYVIKLNLQKINSEYTRDIIFEKLREWNIGVNVHYMPIHLQPFYQNKIKNTEISQPDCKIAENVYNQIITLPLYPTMKDTDVYYVIDVLKYILCM